MSESYFEFNGATSIEMGLRIERVRPLFSPRKRVTSHQIPGRSGDLHQWDGSFENYTISYQCWFKKPAHYEQMAWKAHQILAWLSSAPSGSRLSDTYDAAVYHLASYIGGAEIENIRNTHGRFTISFDVDPRAFIQYGDEFEARPDNPAVLINPTEFPAAPLIKLTGAISGLVTVGAKSITVIFPDTNTHTLYIDLDIKEAWEIVDGAEVSRNQWVSTMDWPILPAGTTEVSVPKSIQSAIIYPRWWTV